MPVRANSSGIGPRRSGRCPAASRERAAPPTKRTYHVVTERGDHIKRQGSGRVILANVVTSTKVPATRRARRTLALDRVDKVTSRNLEAPRVGLDTLHIGRSQQNSTLRLYSNVSRESKLPVSRTGCAVTSCTRTGASQVVVGCWAGVNTSLATRMQALSYQPEGLEHIRSCLPACPRTAKHTIRHLGHMPCTIRVLHSCQRSLPQTRRTQPSPAQRCQERVGHT
jgi:hypothetical protein